MILAHQTVELWDKCAAKDYVKCCDYSWIGYRSFSAIGIGVGQASGSRLVQARPDEVTNHMIFPESSECF